MPDYILFFLTFAQTNQNSSVMTKRILPFMVMLMIIALACNQTSENTSETQAADTVLLTVFSFDTAAGNYVEQPVWIEGTVYHTCKHGGKRMFLVDGSDSIMVQVTTGPAIAKFDESLVGSRIKVLGILKEERIDDKYLNEWEAEVKEPKAEEGTGLHTGEKGHEDHSAEDKLAQISALREELKQSGKPHLSYYSIEAISFTEIK